MLHIACSCSTLLVLGSEGIVVPGSVWSGWFCSAVELGLDSVELGWDLLRSGMLGLGLGRDFVEM